MCCLKVNAYTCTICIYEPFLTKQNVFSEHGSYVQCHMLANHSVLLLTTARETNKSYYTVYLLEEAVSECDITELWIYRKPLLWHSKDLLLAQSVLWGWIQNYAPKYHDVKSEYIIIMGCCVIMQCWGKFGKT